MVSCHRPCLFLLFENLFLFVMSFNYLSFISIVLLVDEILMSAILSSLNWIEAAWSSAGSKIINAIWKWHNLCIYNLSSICILSMFQILLKNRFQLIMYINLSWHSVCIWNLFNIQSTTVGMSWSCSIWLNWRIEFSLWLRKGPLRRVC